MKRLLSFKSLVVLVTVFSLLIAPCATCFAQGVDDDTDLVGAKMVGDVVLARPLGLCATVAGTVFFVISLPFSALGGNTGEAFDRLMADPAKFTFARPLGEF